MIRKNLFKTLENKISIQCNHTLAKRWEWCLSLLDVKALSDLLREKFWANLDRVVDNSIGFNIDSLFTFFSENMFVQTKNWVTSMKITYCSSDYF